MKNKTLITLVLLSFLFIIPSTTAISNDIRWANASSTCILATGSPDNNSITTIGDCIVEGFDMTDLTNPSIYNVSFVYVWNVGALTDDTSTVGYCRDSSCTTTEVILETYNSTNTPVFFMNYSNISDFTSYQYLRNNLLNYTNLLNLRLEIGYTKSGGADSQNTIDAIG